MGVRKLELNEEVVNNKDREREKRGRFGKWIAETRCDGKCIASSL